MGYVWFTKVPLKPLCDSQRYPWNLYLIHNGNLETFMWFTTVPLKPLCDSQRYHWNLYLIHNGTLETFIWFTTVPLKPFSAKLCGISTVTRAREATIEYNKFLELWTLIYNWFSIRPSLKGYNWKSGNVILN